MPSASRRASFALLPFCLLAAPFARSVEVCAVRSGALTMPLVELYTSEGCSSCPPADRWLSRMQRRPEARTANWLAFHVDYWDELGWPDRFASPRHTQRQRERVGAAGKSVVFTPQVMVGDNVTAFWRVDLAFARTLASARVPARAELALRFAGDALYVGAARTTAAGHAPATVWLARSVDRQRTSVRDGENAGAVLHHDRVVTRLWGPWPLSAAPLARRIALEDADRKADYTLFVQDTRGRTWQSLRLSATACR